MANLRETSVWEAGIYQLETSDPVMGGENGIDNRAPRQLANRTLWLKNQIADAAAQIGSIKRDYLAVSAANTQLASKADKNTQFTAGSGLTGGGSLSGNRTISLGTPGQITAASSNSVSAGGHTHAIDSATTARAGIVQLSAAINSTSQTQAATPYAVKQAYDKAVAAERAAAGIELGWDALTGKPNSLAGFGIREWKVEAFEGDVNTLKTDGIYSVTSYVRSRNLPVHQGCHILVLAGTDEAWCRQYAYPAYGNDVYTRHQVSSSNSNWSSWKRADGADWADVRGKPALAAARHNHQIADIDGLQTALADKISKTAHDDISGSKTFTGRVQVPTASASSNDFTAASTAFVQRALSGKVGTSGNETIGGNKTFNGQIYVPTQTAGDNSQRAASTAFVQSAIGKAVPSGTIMYFAGNTPPAGWLKANGARISKTTYPDLWRAIGGNWGSHADYFTLPDLRGEFVRGWDDGRGADSGRHFGTRQADNMPEHHHGVAVMNQTDDLLLIERKWTGGGKTYRNTPMAGEWDRYAAGMMTHERTVQWAGQERMNIGSFVEGGNANTNQLWRTGDINHTDSSLRGTHHIATADQDITSGETRPRNIALLACIKI